ncbi:Endonuclease/exonuclease/phosphatase [Tribonema minus]|uniref:Endonuclease/exonuclease/phosphatase n=1 Tax=Tribonema minus TaxID=303371 RepID=A0A835ZBJ0_9STRA|nr:Endonuclease/exonuclease/phosphatase [Tribonema minus]
MGLRRGRCCCAVVLSAAVLSSAADPKAYCPKVPREPGDRRPNPDRLRIVALNAEYLMYDVDSGCQEAWHGCPWMDAQHAKHHLENVAKAIASLDADIISLAEVRSCAELRALAALLPGGYAPYMVDGRDTYTAQNVGLLTRVDPVADVWRTNARAAYPIEGSVCGYSSSGGGGGVDDDGSTYGVSKNYVAQLALFGGDLKIAVVGLHLLAHPGSVERCARREAQASVLRATVEALAAGGAEVIALGDFNDFDAIAPGESAGDACSGGIGGGGSGCGGGAAQLYNLCARVPARTRFSAWWDKDQDCTIDGAAELSLLDHVLVTEGLAGAVAGVRIAHEYGPFRGQKACVNSDAYVSDHWPIVVDFDLSRVPRGGGSAAACATQ